MMVAGLIKEHNLFASAYVYVQKVFKSKRVIVALMSALTGILPISGRVTVSAGMLDTLAPPKGMPGREKFGIIDYLSTHHYYVWSPLEKTILVPMAALGIGYGAILLELLPLLLVSLGLVFAYIIFAVKEDDIELRTTNERFKVSTITRNVMPFIVAVGVAIAGVHPAIVFGVLTLYYMILTLTWDHKKLLSYVDWKLIAWVAVIIALANITRENTEAINAYLESGPFDIKTVSGFIAISAVSLGSAFLFGSSGRFAAITTMLTLVYGVEYFVWFFALDFIGYLISPMHKCMAIGKLYFNTPWRKYFSALGMWSILLFLAGGSTLVFAEDFKHTETNSFIKSGEYTLGTRQNIDLDVQQYIIRKDFSGSPYRIEYRNVQKSGRQEHWFRGQRKWFNVNGFWYNHRIEHRIREDKDNVFRYRPQFGYKSDNVFVTFEPHINYTYSKKNLKYSHLQTFTGIELKATDKLKIVPFIEVDFDRDFRKQIAFLGVDIKYKL